MNRIAITITLTVAALAAGGVHAEPPEATVAEFEGQEIDDSLAIGYAVSLTDVNADGKTDIVVVDKHRVLWYENPTWKRRVILDGKTKPDNVCVAPADIDGDGKVDLVLGADWNPGNTKTGGTLQWLEQPDDLDSEWSMQPIGEEPTVHRVRTADIDGDGKPEIVLAPLFGRDSSRGANWLDGRPVRLLMYRIPDDPRKGPWEPEVLSETLHVMHNVWPIPARGNGRKLDVLTASYEGVSLVHRDPDGSWTTDRIGNGDQSNPAGPRGASEVKTGKIGDGTAFIATIEPWHGTHVVVYTPTGDAVKVWPRHVLDDGLKGGHAVWCADLDGDGGDEIVIGSREKAGDSPAGQWGLRIYKADKGEWSRQLLDPGAVAVEDAAVADLNGDGKPDIVAVGRATRNVKIYWNQGP